MNGCHYLLWEPGCHSLTKATYMDHFSALLGKPLLLNGQLNKLTHAVIYSETKGRLTACDM